MSDGLAALLEIPCAAEERTVRGRSCKKDEYEWIPRTELDEMKHGSCHIKNNVNQTTEKKNSDIQLEQDNSKNNPMTYAKKIDHCNFINIEKIRSIQVKRHSFESLKIMVLGIHDVIQKCYVIVNFNISVL